MTKERKTSTRRIAATERQAQAVTLRLMGMEYREIAKKLNFRGPSGAYGAVKAALKKTLQGPTDELRKLELLRLDELQQIAWKRVTVAADLKAIDTVLRIMERRSRLLGLDAPVSFSLDDIRDIARKVVSVVTAEVNDELARARIFMALGFTEEAESGGKK